MNKDSMADSLVSASLALVLYILLYLPIEFLVTEIWLVTPRVFPLISLGFLFISVTLLCFVSWHDLWRVKAFRLILAVLVVVSSLVYLKYRQFKLAREYLPKMYKVTREFGFQAEIVKIQGVNFFPAWKKGEVILGDDKMVIKSWDENIIIAEQPVSGKFGQVELYVLRNDGVVSNKNFFTIRDPSSLESF